MLKKGHASKNSKTIFPTRNLKGFLMFLEGIKRGHWPENVLTQTNMISQYLPKKLLQLRNAAAYSYSSK